jgi:NADH dehydrogenase FAD-containing subunit
VLWATGAEAHDWQRDPGRRGNLAVDGQGFVCIDAQLRSLSHPQVFAVGDCASWADEALPKAGVYAVRMGPVLANNLRGSLGAASAAPPQAYRPQRRFLALLATGDGQAIASRGPLGAEGRWAWRWKDRIDRRFLAQFDGLPVRPLSQSSRLPASASNPPTGETA